MTLYNVSIYNRKLHLVHKAIHNISYTGQPLVLCIYMSIIATKILIALHVYKITVTQLPGLAVILVRLLYALGHCTEE